MPADWSTDRVRRYGLISTVLGLVGVFQLIPLAASGGAIALGMVVIRAAKHAGIQDGTAAAKVGVGLGSAGLIVFAIVALVYLD